jgi:hypothetical protein
VDFVTGSTRFGSILGNTHVFSGSVTMNPGGLFVSSSGNVGIGTITPSSKLDVTDTNGIPLRIGDILAAPSSQTAGYIGMSTSAYSGNNGDLVLYPRTSAASKILLMGGNIIINGTTSQNDATNRGNLTINGATSILNLSTNNTNAAYLYHNGTDLLLVNAKNGAALFYTNDTERMRITSSGSVIFSTINTNAQIARNGLYYYENISLVDDHTAIVLLLGTYSYATYKIDVVVSIADTMETTATFLVDIKETTVQSTILGGFSTTNLAIISETSPVGTDTKFNFILNAQSGNSYLAIRNRRGGDRRAYIKIECLSTR